MLYNGSDVIRDLEWVIFDEVHYINDAEVGWQCKVLCLYVEKTVKPVLSSHTSEAKKWLLRAGGCLMEVNIITQLKFVNILFGCLINRDDR